MITGLHEIASMHVAGFVSRASVTHESIALASRGACVRLCDFFTRLFFVKLFFGSYKLLMDFVIK